MKPEVEVKTVCPVCKHELVSVGEEKYRGVMLVSHAEASKHHRRTCRGVPATTATPPRGRS